MFNVITSGNYVINISEKKKQKMSRRVLLQNDIKALHNPA